MEDKKSISNRINYMVNKKMDLYSDKLDTILEKMNSNSELNSNILKLTEYILNLEDRIKSLEEEVISLKNKNYIEPVSIEKVNSFPQLSIDYITPAKKIEKINSLPQFYLEEDDYPSPSKVDSISIYRELKADIFDIDKDFVKSCLDMNNIDNDFILFKKMYIDDIPKEYYPIRHIKKKYQYWLNNHMNDDDSNATYIKNTIIKNIENSYLNVNNYERYKCENNIDQFIRNQEYISKLNVQKYKDNFLKKIVKIITI
jgi:hypothetical protein